MILINWYFKIFNFIAAKRLELGDLDPRRIHSHLVIVLSTGLLMWSYALLAVFTISSPVPGIVGLICALTHLLSPLLFRLSGNIFFISTISVGAGIIHQGTFAYYTGGFKSFILIWLGILPMLGGIIAGRKVALFWAAISATWAGTYLIMEINGYPFPDLITPQGRLIANAFIVFGWIFLSTSIIYVSLLLNENREKILASQAKKIEDLFRVLFHDLAGPLSRISIGLKISKREVEPEHKEHGIEIASKATDAMLEITQNVRKMYAVSKGKVSPDLVYCSLNEAVEYIQKVYAPELEKKNISLEFDTKKHTGLKVLVEPISFKNQVLGNVLSNAIKFSPTDTKITVHAYPLNDFHVIEIADHGIGMGPQLINSLFDITKKTSRAGTSGETGTGFGMHIMKSFIEMYQGKIEIESNDEENSNSGTIIKLYLKGEWTQGGSPLPE